MFIFLSYHEFDFLFHVFLTTKLKSRSIKKSEERRKNLNFFQKNEEKKKISRQLKHFSYLVPVYIYIPAGITL